MGHPAAQPDEADDVELLATIKPPKSKFEVMQLSEKLSAMSAQVATARSDASAKENMPYARGVPKEDSYAAAHAPLGGLLGVVEEASPAPVFESQLPPARYGGGLEPTPQYPQRLAQPQPAAPQPSTQAALQPVPRVEDPEPPLPQGWKKVN